VGLVSAILEKNEIYRNESPYFQGKPADFSFKIRQYFILKRVPKQVKSSGKRVVNESKQALNESIPVDSSGGLRSEQGVRRTQRSKLKTQSHS
jgi:hypothetical protein